jgi:LCP family protein required for cell wall assembly
MSDTSGQNGPVDPGRPGGEGTTESQVPGPVPRKRRGLRIALVLLASSVVFLGTVTIGVYLLVNQLMGGIHRIPLKVTVSGRSEKAVTVLITGSQIGPISASWPGSSGLIMLLHIDADGRTGGVVSIPPQTVVPVPGHGQAQINDTLAHGGASLLLQTVEQLTHVQINHYAQIDFTHVASVINNLGGVDVPFPDTATAFKYKALAGEYHLTGLAAIYYARQHSLTEEGRVLRQQSLIRAVAQKLANENMLSSPVTAYRVIESLTKLLTVDSNFTNSAVLKFATEFRVLSRHSETFVTAPTYTAAGHIYLNSSLADQLWTAIRGDSIAAFAKKYPSTVTPPAPH